MLSLKQGEGTEHHRAFCESAEQAQSGADETRRSHSKHRRDEEETKQLLSSSTSTLEKRRKRSRPRTNSWSCHSRQSTKLGQYLAQSTWTFRFDLSLKTDGQTNTWHSGKDTILTVCHGQTNTCHSSGQIEIGATGKKDDKCFLVLNT